MSFAEPPAAQSVEQRRSVGRLKRMVAALTRQGGQQRFQQNLDADGLHSHAKLCAEAATNGLGHTPRMTSSHAPLGFGFRTLLAVAPVTSCQHLSVLAMFSGSFPALRWELSSSAVNDPTKPLALSVVPGSDVIGSWAHDDWCIPSTLEHPNSEGGERRTSVISTASEGTVAPNGNEQHAEDPLVPTTHGQPHPKPPPPLQVPLFAKIGAVYIYAMEERQITEMAATASMAVADAEEKAAAALQRKAAESNTAKMLRKKSSIAMRSRRNTQAGGEEGGTAIGSGDEGGEQSEKVKSPVLSRVSSLGVLSEPEEDAAPDDVVSSPIKNAMISLLENIKDKKANGGMATTQEVDPLANTTRSSIVAIRRWKFSGSGVGGPVAVVAALLMPSRLVDSLATFGSPACMNTPDEVLPFPHTHVQLAGDASPHLLSARHFPQFQARLMGLGCVFPRPPETIKRRYKPGPQPGSIVDTGGSITELVDPAHAGPVIKEVYRHPAVHVARLVPPPSSIVDATDAVMELVLGTRGTSVESTRSSQTRASRDVTTTSTRRKSSGPPPELYLDGRVTDPDVRLMSTNYGINDYFVALRLLLNKPIDNLPKLVTSVPDGAVELAAVVGPTGEFLQRDALLETIQLLFGPDAVPEKPAPPTKDFSMRNNLSLSRSEPKHKSSTASDANRSPSGSSTPQQTTPRRSHEANKGSVNAPPEISPRARSVSPSRTPRKDAVPKTSASPAAGNSTKKSRLASSVEETKTTTSKREPRAARKSYLPTQRKAVKAPKPLPEEMVAAAEAAVLQYPRLMHALRSKRFPRISPRTAGSTSQKAARDATAVTAAAAAAVAAQMPPLHNEMGMISSLAVATQMQLQGDTHESLTSYLRVFQASASWNAKHTARQLMELGGVPPLTPMAAQMFVEANSLVFLTAKLPRRVPASRHISTAGALAGLDGRARDLLRDPEGFHLGWTVAIAGVTHKVGKTTLIDKLEQEQLQTNAMSGVASKSPQGAFAKPSEDPDLCMQDKWELEQQEREIERHAMEMARARGTRTMRVKWAPPPSGFLERRLGKRDASQRSTHLFRIDLEEVHWDPTREASRRGHGGNGAGALQSATVVLWVVNNQYAFEQLMKRDPISRLKQRQAQVNGSGFTGFVHGVIFLPRAAAPTGEGQPATASNTTAAKSADQYLHTAIAKWCTERDLAYAMVDLTDDQGVASLQRLIVQWTLPKLQLPVDPRLLPPNVEVGSLFTQHDEHIQQFLMRTAPLVHRQMQSNFAMDEEDLVQAEAEVNEGAEAEAALMATAWNGTSRSTTAAASGGNTTPALGFQP